MGDQEAHRQLLEEIGLLSDRVRELRGKSAAHNKVQIHALEVEGREKWQRLRALRAGPATSDSSTTRGSGHYQ